jgi:hypothetical protein
MKRWPDKPSLLQQWKALTFLQRGFVIAIISGLMILVITMGQQKKARQLELLRIQFHLPASVEFVHFETEGSKMRHPRLEATVRFSENEFNAYLASLNDKNLWAPRLGKYRYIESLTGFSPEAGVWQSQRPPLHYGTDGMADWGIYADETLLNLKQARYYCLAIISSTSGHKAIACKDLSNNQDANLVIEAVLDTTTRTLYLRY